MKVKYISLLLVIVYQHAAAQLTLKYGLELGATVAVFSKKDNNQISNPRTPLIGLTTETTIGKHLQITLGAEYQKTDERSYFYYSTIGMNTNISYTSETWEKQIFHKLCFPVNIGYAINIWKLKPSVFVGYRLNYFMAGKYYKKYVLHDNNTLRDEGAEFQFNPVDINQTQQPVKHLNNQLLAGVSCSIGRHLKVTAIGNFGNVISYARTKNSDVSTSFRNTDYLVSLIYFFKPLIN